jgi:hypothetical protein
MSWYRDLRKDIWKYMLVGMLVMSIGLNIYNYSILQDNRARVNLGSRGAAVALSLSLGRATSFLNVNTSDEISISIQAFIDIGQGALETLWTLIYLNPANEIALEPVEYLFKNLFVANDNPPTVPQVLEQLQKVSSDNATAAIKAITELEEITSQKIQEMGQEVAQAFASEEADVSRLYNAANLANELNVTINQWIDKYSVS